MNWDKILRIRAWTPLHEVAPRSEMVLPGVYTLSENAYLVTQRYNREFESDLPDAPFVTLAVWAESLNVLRRCLNHDAAVQVQCIGSNPPDELLIGTHGIYLELAQRIPAKTRKTAERAVYSNSGAFVHKTLEIDRFTFCFLALDILEDERAYAIKVSLL